MMELQLTIRVHSVEEITPRPYLDQIKYIAASKGDRQQKDDKSFSFTHPPNNRELVMGVFDHVSNILAAVQSPVPNTPIAQKTDNIKINHNICVEAVLKPSKIKKANKYKRYSSSKSRKRLSFKFGGYGKCMPENRLVSQARSYAESLAAQFTPIGS